MLRFLHALCCRFEHVRLWRACAYVLLLTVVIVAGASVSQASIVAAATPTDRADAAGWMQHHQQILAQVRAHAQTPLLLIGDAIFRSSGSDAAGASAWQRFYGVRGALDLGVDGDATEHVLWRLQHGELDGIQPKVAMLLLRTAADDRDMRSADDTVLGIDALLATLEQRLPKTRILLLGLLPGSGSAQARARVDEVNRMLAVRYGEHPRVTYLDVGAVLSGAALSASAPQAAESLRTSVAAAPFATPQAQQRLAEAIEPTLARLLDEPPQIPLSAMSDLNTALIPVPWLEQDSYDWYARHHAVLAQGQRLQPQIVLLGDSITHFWGGPPLATRVGGAQAWRRTFGSARVLNLGFGWDRTQNVLWRLRQGELDGLAPRWVVINIGTNNLAGTDHARTNTPQETADGVAAVVAEVRRRLPHSKIVLMAILPRGFAADGPLRSPILATNRLLAARFGHDAQVRWLDIGARFLQPDGSLPAALMPDSTHPSEDGYRIWGDALRAVGVGG
ncbi:GDSL-type esterase/lipase family protein [Xanthomonas albilineans]|uniref:GDSL-type esterase/lipase family protein n=1 Tax=Xanthomonas albilineans TaxID=29447 RepID=UPI0005F355A8|nr:GDSL-type esterase/lipase family protein [Xanthomonas albilineans]PPU92312.1 acetylhydrolase [Xanthomonas albilineans]